ncbi:TPR end-of-group domain-containing protein [Granulicella arctica]|uniref:TolB-like protein n=1 Tax=Granulicella arctica TaxID=940613 RepID=A0A7Y9PHZ3_9BACT|nr:tetratricopeptide repeat protein [Granulicella arctica]NYF80242.1 TolB-like protein [Granulicella arctica]
MPTIDPFSKPGELDPERIELIRGHLKDVISSPAFAGSRRAQDFLQLIVEHALAGRFDSLRERMIGAEMFGRPIGYDTANDAVVRVKATEVRKKLAQYYQESVKPLGIRIELPIGSYVPRFHVESWEKLSGLPSESPPVASGQQGTIGEEEPSYAAGESARRTLRGSVGIVAGMVLIVAIGFIGFKVWSKKASAKPEVHAIAILPLQNLSGDPRQEYFADGMTEELIADLGQVSLLRVISRTSVMSYKGTKKTLPEIGRELGVDAIVEGSVLREGNEVRITAQLIDAKTDQHIWARSYVRDLTSVLALQGEVAQTIADEISINVTPQEQARLTRPRPVSEEAQDLYLLGIHLLNSGDPRRASNYLQEAIDKDPNYAPAHAALANAYGWLGEAGWLPYAAAFPRQKAEATKAIEIDDALPEGHIELANAVMDLSWDWTTCERELKRTLELNPNSASTHSTYSSYLLRVGRLHEAIEETKRDLELDPVSSRSFMRAGFIYYYARQYDEAEAQLQRSTALEPSPAEVLFPLAVIHEEKGMYQEAIDGFQKLGDQPHALGHMGNAYARAGRVAEAHDMISKLQGHVEKDGVGRYEIALVYAGLGDKDGAFGWLEKAFAAHDKGLTYLKIDPCMDPLRSDPRFQDLVRRVGFPS